MAKPDDKIPKINPTEVELLIKKFEQNKLAEREKQLIAGLLRTLLSLVSLLQDKKVTIMRLKQMIFGKKGETRKRDEARKGGAGNEPEGQVEETAKDETPNSPRDEKPAGPEGADLPIKRGHGRNPASAYVGARKVHCRHRELGSGSKCPDSRCEGRVYPVKRPHHFLQFTGQPVMMATHYEQDVVRCGDCGRE